MNQTSIKKTNLISDKIFRSYDIRGIYDETLTTEHAYLIGQAIGTEARQSGNNKIITARDGRNSSPILTLALQQGLLASGCDVIDVGMAPTPVLYFATHVLSTHSGVMVTGSHNPSHYNGFKIVLNGKTLAEQNIKKLYERICTGDLLTGHGTISHCDVISNYIQRILPEIKIQKNLKVAIDCSNGMASLVIPELLSATGCEIIELFTDVDGNFPNHDPDPSQPKNLSTLIAMVLKHHADVGLIFDGDADRIGMVTDRGEIIWPDRMMMLLAQAVLKTNKGRAVIFDVKCSSDLGKIIEKNNGIPHMWKTGHSLIKAKMQETHAVLAGEMSGHIFFKDRWYGFDDGIYTAMRLLEIISQDTENVSTLFNEFPKRVNTPELRIAISEEKKFSFMDRFIQLAQFDDGLVSTIDGIRVEFDNGWGLLRASNTSPNLIARFEADHEETLQKIKTLFYKQLLQLDRNLKIPF